MSYSVQHYVVKILFEINKELEMATQESHYQCGRVKGLRYVKECLNLVEKAPTRSMLQSCVNGFYDIIESEGYKKLSLNDPYTMGHSNVIENYIVYLGTVLRRVN